MNFNLAFFCKNGNFLQNDKFEKLILGSSSLHLIITLPMVCNAFGSSFHQAHMED